MATTIGDLQVLIKGDASSLMSAITKSVGGLGAVNVAAGAVVGGLAVLAGAAVSAALEYERAFTRIEALSNANAEAVGQWKEQVLDLAGETAQAPQELADALFFLSSAGLKTEDVMEALEASAKASAVGLGETADIARITAQVLNAYADSGMTATDVTDTLVAAVKAGSAEPEEFADALGRVISIASKAGVEFDEVAASLAGLSNVGIDVNEGVTAMTSLLTSMVAPTKQTQVAMQELGISTEELRRVLSEEGLLAAMQLLEDRSGGNLDVLKALVPNVRALRGQLGLTGDNAEQVAGIFDQVTNSTGSLGEAFGTTEESVGFMLEQLKASVQVALVELGDKLLPILIELVPIVTDLAVVIGEKLAGAMDFAVDAAQPAIDAISLLGDVMSDVSSEGSDVPGFWSNVADSIAGNLFPTNQLASAYGEAGDKAAAAEKQIEDFRAALATSAFDQARDDLEVIEGLWNDYVVSVNSATSAEENHAEALGLTVSAMREAAGGLLGLIEAARTYKEAQQEVNRLEAAGKEGTKKYRDAVADLLTQRLELTAVVGDLQEEWKQEGTSLQDAKAALRQVGVQAGLSGGALKTFINEGLRPVRGELDKLHKNSPYNAVADVSVQGREGVSNLQHDLIDLTGRKWQVNVAVHTEAGSPWPDEALQAHLIDPLKAWGFKEIAGKMTLPLTVGVHTPGAVMGAGATGVTPGGMGRKRTESYLDRERFERDHAYSREYEGWR